jgi:hypothetical protein
MKFLITLLLLTSFSVFAEPVEGENGDATTQNENQPCNPAVVDAVTPGDKSEAQVPVTNEVPAGSTKQ